MPTRAGDVVICSRPVEPAESVIKRIAACPGEEVLLYPDAHHKDVRKIKASAVTVVVF